MALERVTCANFCVVELRSSDSIRLRFLSRASRTSFGLTCRDRTALLPLARRDFIAILTRLLLDFVLFFTWERTGTADMNTDELREKYLSFFQSKGHHRQGSDVLVPTWDPSVLFTPAGMNQFKDHFLVR